MELLIPQRLATLGHAQRLAVFRLLMRRYPDRVPATELAQALGVKPNTLSAYLKALMQVGLITQAREGTSLRYSVHMEAVRETFNYLWLDCGRGRPELQSFLDDGAAPPVDRRYNVLFLCTGNSARSIIAESILNAEAGDRFSGYSAGTHPRAAPNAVAMALLEQKGHDLSALRSKCISEFQTDDSPHFDFVFTVCDNAANEECPAWSGQPISAHWSLPDPARVEGLEAERQLAFQQTYGALRNRILSFTSLPIASLDRVALQKAVDDIGQTETGDHP